jgi:anti-sigma regulatory factor (Ser/Thr protein kinase)
MTQLDFGESDLDSVRRLVSRQARTARLKGTRAAELVTAVNEVATNSIRHGGGAGTLLTWQEQSALVCEIRDRGRFENPVADRRLPAPDVSSPRGLWLANHLCDLVQIRSLAEGTVVRLHMKRNPDQHLHVVPDVQEEGSGPD